MSYQFNLPFAGILRNYFTTELMYQVKNGLKSPATY